MWLETHPLHNTEHGHFVFDIKAQKHSVPVHIPQSLHTIQVRRARGVLQLNACWKSVVRALADVRLVERSGDYTRLFGQYFFSRDGESRLGDLHRGNTHSEHDLHVLVSENSGATTNVGLTKATKFVPQNGSPQTESSTGPARQDEAADGAEETDCAVCAYG